jgi:predicted SprT family Zn-dependent metalloprotease
MTLTAEARFEDLDRKTVRRLKKTLDRCARLWELPRAFSSKLSVVYSPRLSRSLGRCDASTRQIRLHQALQSASEAVFVEVLVHELAHLAVLEKHGSGCRPHGKEWAFLMRAAGYEPRVQLKLADLPDLGAKKSKPQKVIYVHRCLICHSERKARRPVPRWRCADCVAAGLDGQLEITSRPTR